MNNPQKGQKAKQDFRNKLLKHVESFNSVVSTGSGDWVIKGSISAYN